MLEARCISTYIFIDFLILCVDQVSFFSLSTFSPSLVKTRTCFFPTCTKFCSVGIFFACLQVPRVKGEDCIVLQKCTDIAIVDLPVDKWWVIYFYAILKNSNCSFYTHLCLIKRSHHNCSHIKRRCCSELQKAKLGTKTKFPARCFWKNIPLLSKSWFL